MIVSSSYRGHEVTHPTVHFILFEAFSQEVELKMTSAACHGRI